MSTYLGDVLKFFSRSGEISPAFPFLCETFARGCGELSLLEDQRVLVGSLQIRPAGLVFIEGCSSPKPKTCSSLSVEPRCYICGARFIST